LRSVLALCEHTFVRWDNLRIDADEHASLPGYREPAVVRHFDAPEALDTRFYEVRAKSALNRVPERSRMPFRWTVNPYRGCSHACVYCLAGDTPILMADGRTQALASLNEGDRIYGTQWEGASRRLELTDVRAHWSTVKPAYRVTLDDGTELVASADHRFLTERGWSYVTGAAEGRGRRPHLTAGTRLVGVGPFADAPTPTLDYRRGYLCGLIRGGGDVSSYAADGVDRVGATLAGGEALQRARAYLEADSVATQELPFLAADGRRRASRASGVSAHASAERVREVIRWPLSPSDDWRKGFLAGVFDTEGTCSSASWRIPYAGPVILGWTVSSLAHLGFDAIVEDRLDAQGTVRLRGGAGERMRFFQLTDPAVARRRFVDAQSLDVRAGGRVEAVEPLGRAMRLYDITTGTGDFIAGGVVSHNCFARPTHTYLDMGAGRDFEKKIVVKVNAPEVLRAELGRPSWKREHVAMGTNTDPYQWVEGRYKLMRGIWEALRDHATPCSVLTKSPLLLRDLDLMLEVAQVTDIAANVSVPTIDEKAWRASEPHTPNPRARIEAVAELNRAGIPAGVLVAPLMPGINDDPRQIETILQAAGDAGATGISGIALHLRGEVRGIFMEWLRSYRPDLVPRYEELYRRGAYAPRDEQDRLRALLRKVRSRTAGAPPRRSPADTRGVRREGVDGGDAFTVRRIGSEPPAEPTTPGGAQVPRQEALF
jgi:DNA repair photolyase